MSLYYDKILPNDLKFPILGAPVTDYPVQT